MNSENDSYFYTVSREDYLIAIYLLQKQKPDVRSIDVADMLGYSKPSVSNGIHLLIENELLDMDSDRFLRLTEKGQKKAEDIYQRYKTVKDFFQLILGVDERIAEKDSRSIEHLISTEVLQKMETFLQNQIK